MGRNISLGALGTDPAVSAIRTAPARVVEAAPEVRESGTSEVPAVDPTYNAYVRKETRLRQDQLDDLAVLARRLNRTRGRDRRRITENTLIRVAVDALLDRQATLAGRSEDELRAMSEP